MLLIELERFWDSRPERVRAPYRQGEQQSRIQSTTRHGKPCGKSGGPPPKAEYYPVTDSVQYREGKVKSTPGGE